jgi:hypothetical protein
MRAALAVALILATASVAHADGEVEAEVRAAVVASYASIAADLVDTRDGISAEGALQFWSSGGLMLRSSPEDLPIEYESFSVEPKHIEVIVLSDAAAVAMYYAEGSMQPKGRDPVPRYLTRVMEVFVKEDGVWRERAGHWSPLQGGDGTSRATD